MNVGLKRYEISNHLGNVLATITDRPVGVDSITTNESVEYFEPSLASASDYYPFGMLMPGRNIKSQVYPSGFNGKENDNEVKGNGNQQDYGLRIYDPRLGRFLSVDPLAASFAWNSPYCFAENSPIWGIDLDGGEFITYLDKFKNAAQELKKETSKQIEQKTNAAASAALIKTAQTIFPGVEKANETIKQAQFKSNPENSVAILLYEFATGTGKDNRTFNYGEKGSFANSFVQGRVLTEVQSDFAGKMSEMTASEFVKSGAKFGLEFSPDHAGLQESVEKHMDSNFPQFFVGGANVSVSATDDANWVNVSINNPTSRGSLMLHQGKNYPRDGKDGGTEKPLSTITQTFTFKMKIDPSKFKQEEKKM
jgi:RHS repeat-associated protein